MAAAQGDRRFPPPANCARSIRLVSAGYPVFTITDPLRTEVPRLVQRTWGTGHLRELLCLGLCCAGEVARIPGLGSEYTMQGRILHFSFFPLYALPSSFLCGSLVS